MLLDPKLMLLLLLEWRDRLRHALRPAWVCPEQFVSLPAVAFGLGLPLL